MHELLTNRAMSGFPVSIGTGLALETLFQPTQDVIDESRDVIKMEDLSQYSLYVFNLSTLLRNLISTLPSKELFRIPRKEILATLVDEMDFITNHFDAQSIEVKFYVHTYKFVKDVYRDPKYLRKPSTDQQHLIESITEYCLEKLKKEESVSTFHKDIKYEKQDSVLLFTHVPFDLLSHGRFMKLDLLESHTGLIKTRKDWWSKYYPIPREDMSFMPFHEYALSVFGDRVMFKPAPLAERKSLLESMRKKGVNPLTSELGMVFLKT